MLGNAKAGSERAVAAVQEITDLAVGAQLRAYEALGRRGQATVDELKAVAA